MHKLQAPAFIDPRWFNQMRSGKHEATVIDAQSVEVKGQVLRLSIPAEVQLVPGRKTYVILNGHFYLETEEEYQERQHKIETVRKAEAEAYRARSNELRARAELFNASLYIPVKWLSGMKDVLSGLSAKSDGTGTNAATVTHIWLQEDLHDGKLHRSKFDFLCTSASGSNGKQWSGQTEDWRADGDGTRYQAKVTCKACLKIAQHWHQAS